MKSSELAAYGGYELIERGGNIPPEADFSLVITDKSMEPHIKQNSTVYVQARAELEEFDTGIFLCNGRIICRQWCQDILGNIHLLCANPAFEKENISISSGEREKLSCLGRVLLKKKLPAPGYY